MIFRREAPSVKPDYLFFFLPVIVACLQTVSAKQIQGGKNAQNYILLNPCTIYS
jgi:hypothetical protein